MLQERHYTPMMHFIPSPRKIMQNHWCILIRLATCFGIPRKRFRRTGVGPSIILLIWLPGFVWAWGLG